MTAMHELTLKELSSKIQGKEVSVQEVVETTFARINETDEKNWLIHYFKRRKIYRIS